MYLNIGRNGGMITVRLKSILLKYFGLLFLIWRNPVFMKTAVTRSKKIV